MVETMDALQHLLIVAACRETILRAAAAADAGDSQAVANRFAADAVLERPGAPALHGRDAIRSSYAARSTDRLTRHLVTNTLVEVSETSEARATSLVLLWSASMADVAGQRGRPATGQVVGEFHDVLRLTGEGWRIAHRKALFVLHSEP